MMPMVDAMIRYRFALIMVCCSTTPVCLFTSVKFIIAFNYNKLIYLNYFRNASSVVQIFKMRRMSEKC